MPESSSNAIKEQKITGIGDLFSKSFNFYNENFTPLVKILLIFILAAVPIWIITGARVVAAEFWGYTEYGFTPINILFGVLGIIAFLISVYISISAKATLFSYFKQKKGELSIKELFHKCRREYFWPLLIVNILVGVFVFLWSLLLIIPGLIFAVYYAFAGWVFIFEGHKGIEALKRSKSLIKGHWWSVVVRYLVLYLILYLILIVLGVIVEVGGGGIFGMALETIKQLISFLFVPLLYVYSYFIYQDLLKIKENK